MISRTKKAEYNATRRHERAERKMSQNIRQIAADLMAKEGIDLGQAMKRAIATVASRA